MAIIAPATKEFKRELPPTGNLVARCWMVCDLGVHEGEYMGEKTFTHKVKFAWELTGELMQEGDNKGKPFSVFQDYTLSMGSKANLRKVINAWRGVPFTDEEANSFDIAKLIGKPCLVNIFHKTSRSGSVYANISSVSPIPKGFDVPELVNKPLVFSLSDMDGKEGIAYKDLPDWLKKMINVPEDTFEPSNDDIPFK